MSTYVIGDIHGHYATLCQLLKKINFNFEQDMLWFTGDLVGGGCGQQSIEILHFIKQLDNKAKIVLGNHDITLLSYYKNLLTHKISTNLEFDYIISHSQCDEIMDWLSHQKLAYYDSNFNVLLVHAGLPPQWSISDAISHAQDVEILLQESKCAMFFQNVFGNQPDFWHADLQGWDRARFILNALTRIRFCYQDGRLDFQHKGKVETTNNTFIPWYNMPNRLSQDTTILFGHWAALRGHTDEHSAIALDTGCRWGQYLTAYCLDNQQFFKVACIN